MAKWLGNQDVPPWDTKLDKTSFAQFEPPNSAYTDSFSSARVTHKLPKPKGESDQAGQRPYRAGGNEPRGPALDRAIPRQGPYSDRATRFGEIGNGVDGDRNPPGRWDKSGKSTEGFDTPLARHWRRAKIRGVIDE